MLARFIALVGILSASPGLAQPGQTPRYQVVALGDGFVRLDTVTGAMAVCRGDVGRLRCEALAVEAARDADNHKDRASAGAVPDVEPKGDSAAKAEPGDDRSMEDFDKALTMMEKAMRRFMALTRENPGECEL